MQWPEAVSGVSETYAIPEFTEDPSLSANATATTEAIQAAINTRQAVLIPAGIYYLNATLALTTQGQIIRGESGTRNYPEWTADVHGFEIQESSESTATNFPGSTGVLNAWGRVTDLLLRGPVGIDQDRI